MSDLPYLAGYPAHVIEQVKELIVRSELASHVKSRYPTVHSIQTDKALYEYVNSLKQQYLKKAPPLSKVLYDNKLDLVKGLLGTHTFTSRVQGSKLKSKNEIRIASLLREAPEAFLQVLVVHELAHLKEKDHNKAFYQLCRHMLRDYHQLEFDLRLWLTVKSHSHAK